MPEEPYKATPYGYLYAIPLNTWVLHPWTTGFTEANNFREVTITNGGVLNKGLTGNLYITFRTDDVTETCDIGCGEVTALFPGDSLEGSVGYNMKLWINTDTDNMSIKVEEKYPV
jgi:hypothetical protein